MKHTPQQQEFLNKFVCNEYDKHKLYWKAFFHKDGDLAVVRRTKDYRKKDAWGCVNLSNEKILPFIFEKIRSFGIFFVAEDSESEYLYDKNGNNICEIVDFQETEHEDYHVIRDESEELRLIYKKNTISHGSYLGFHVEENGLMFLEDIGNNVGLIYQNQIILPFDYEAISVPQDLYSLAIKESPVKADGEKLYDCFIIEYKEQIEFDNAVRLTNIKLFENKEWDEVEEYFENTERVRHHLKSLSAKELNVYINPEEISFFPFNGNLPCHLFDKEERDYCQWSNYSLNESLYDALGGDMDAIWNLD